MEGARELQTALLAGAWLLSAVASLVTSRKRKLKKPSSLHRDASEAEIQAHFNEHGYILIRGFFDKAQVAETRRRLDYFIQYIVPTMPEGEVFYDVKGDDTTLKQLQKMYLYDDYFKGLFSNEFQKLSEVCLGGRTEGKNMQYFNKVPRFSKPTPPHQDGFYFQIKPQRAVTGWIALDRADEENGCLRYVKGSHNGGMRDHHLSGTLGFSQCLKQYPAPGDLSNEMVMACSPGDVVMHNSLMVHRADKNSSTDRQRRALGFIYYHQSCTVDEAVKAYQQKIRAEWKRKGML